MGWRLPHPWGRNGEARKGPKTMSIYVGFFFVVNYCLGTGFLGIPYAFFYSGYLAAIPALLFISVVSWINANYLLEVMARAQALEYFKRLQNPASDSDTTDSELDQKKFLNSVSATKDHQPKFEITVKRKFELSELCEIFVSKYLKYAYLCLFGVFGFLASWSFATVAGSAWAINIPFNFGAAERCSETAFFHNVIPSGGCLYAYYFSLGLFALIVVTLSLIDLKEQAFIQLTLGVMRFLTIAAILIFCIVRLVQGGDACVESLEMDNFTSASVNVGMRDTVLKFEVTGLVVAVPVFAFAFLFHTGIASLTHPVREKKHLHWLLVSMFAASTLAYFSLGVIVPLWFRASIQETCTLNWALFTHRGHSASLRALSYYLILFPTLDVVSAYPLMNHVIVNNLYIIITGNDTSKKAKHRFDVVLRVVLRLIVAILPILAAFGVANLIYVLKYAGLLGFICYLFPFVLQLRSIYVCKKKFCTPYFSMSGIGPSEGRNSDDEDSKNKGEISPKEKESLLLARDLDSKGTRALYMTPYSVLVISHPVSVTAIGIIGLFLFILAFSSLFVHPHKITCESLLESILHAV